MTRATMSQQLLIIAVGLVCVHGVSVDPDMMESFMDDIPLQAESEDVFIFPSMRVNPLSLDVRVNYRGMPPSKQEVDLPSLTERARSQDVTHVTEVASDPSKMSHRVGEVAAPTLRPGSGSWMFSTIVNRARAGLQPTHVPRARDMMHGEASEAVATVPGMAEDEERVTIPPEYKQILLGSNDYQKWLNLKNNFLREHRTLKNLEMKNNVPSPGAGSVRSQDDKFPHFPGAAGEISNSVDVLDTSESVGDIPRPQREIPTGTVYKEGDTLYRSPTSPAPRHKPKADSEPHSRLPASPRRPPRVQVSSLPVTSPRPGTTYSSPLYPGTPFYTTPQPPLPPGYELIPVDQLTEDHEVVPWEELPHLMREHNMSINTIPLGPFHHSTPAPVTVFSSKPRYPSPKTTPSPSYTTASPVYTSKKPFTVFSPIPTKLQTYTVKPKHSHQAPMSPYIPPPVSPEMSQSLYYGQVTPKHHHHPGTASTAKSRPKSIHFGTHFGPKTVKSSTVSPNDIVSNTFRYNPTTVPNNNYDHTPSLSGHSAVQAVQAHVSSTVAPALPTLGRYSPFPAHFKTTSTPHFESTKSHVHHHGHPAYKQLSSSPKYHPVQHYPTTTTKPKYYQSTTAKYFPTSTLTTALLQHSTTRAPYVPPSSTVKYFAPQTTPEPAYSPPPMPKYLPPPNQQHPTYFDVAKPVAPVPPPSPRPQVIPDPPSPTRHPQVPPQPIFHVDPVPVVHNVQHSSNSLHPSGIFKPTVAPRKIVSSTTTLSAAPIVLQGRLRPADGLDDDDVTDNTHVVLPSNVNHDTLAQLNEQRTLSNPVATIDQNDLDSSEETRGGGIQQFDHFTQRSSGQAEKLAKLKAAVTTLGPDRATRNNPNKMRSSTQRNLDENISRTRPRPVSPNFHPIRPRPTPSSRLQLVPQIRAKVPATETDSGEARRERTPDSDLSVITNDNNGVWFIEEKIEKQSPPLKREFVDSSGNKTTVNPALTEKPRTWPSNLSFPRQNDIYDDVKIVEKSINGQIGQGSDQTSRAESTTFSTSRVEMSVSTTPRPQQLLQLADRKKIEDFENQSNSALKDLMLKKAQNLLDTLAHKEKKLAVQSFRPGLGKGGKRKRLRQQPKSLPGGESGDGAYVVYPMAKENVENKDVDEIFNHHPGLKRISAYDFEKAMEKTQDSITKPVAELKVSIETLANTMNQLSRNVLETSTKPEPDLPSENDKISQLQEEIAKLTKTLEMMQLSPREAVLTETMMLSPTEHVSRVLTTERPPPVSSPNIDFQASQSVNSWNTAAGESRDNLRHSKPAELDIIEVQTQKPTTITQFPLMEKKLERVQSIRGRPQPQSTSTQKTPADKTETSEHDISKFFGDSTEAITRQDDDQATFIRRKMIENKFQEDTSKSSHDFNDIISQDQLSGEDNYRQAGVETTGKGGVLGLFEMMGKINKEATQNFDVVKLPTQTENSIKAIQQQLRFDEMQEKFRIEQIDKIRSEEEELRKQQMEKLKLFNLFQEEEKKLHQQQSLNDQNKFKDDEIQQNKPDKMERLNNNVATKSFENLQGWDDSASWDKDIKTLRSNAKTGDNGMAYASITIEDVNHQHDRDYHVSNGLVTLKKDDSFDIGDTKSFEYEYEYFEADPDDIQFPVGGTRQFYESQAKKNVNDNSIENPLDNIDQLSNKELLLNLLQASDNFQNRDFLDRLKTIVTGPGPGPGTNVRAGSGTAPGVTAPPVTVSTVRTDKWAPANSLPGSSRTKLENNVNSLPIWPANSNVMSRDNFEPSGGTFRFPNRRMDDGFGVGEISLVSDVDRRKITSVGGFQSSPPIPSSASSGSRISDRLDFTSDNEFVVGTTLTARNTETKNYGGSESLSNFNSGVRSFGGGESLSSFDSGVGYATPVPRHSSDLGLRVPLGTASPLSLVSGVTSRGSEVFRLGSGIQIQQPGAGQGGHSPVRGEISQNSQNYILPTYTQSRAAEHREHGSAENGEIYADIRLESGKKNLLTAPGAAQDPHSLYIHSGQARPEAEVIVYPMGQLLSSPSSSSTGEVMAMSGSAVDLSATRDQVPASSYNSYPQGASMTRTRSQAPKGLLETIIRTAKDDLDFAGNVLNFITSRSK